MRTGATDPSAVAAYHRLLSAEPAESLDAVAGVILAAGRGRRLAPLTDAIPKPLLPVLNLPLLLWAMAQMHQAGIDSVCANLWYRPEAFAEFRDICLQRGPRLIHVKEPRPTGPLGGALSCRDALANAADYVILSGDALSDIDLRQLVVAHRRQGAELTMTVQQVPDASRFGVLTLDTDGYVHAMREKPHDACPLEYVSCGVYVISHRLLARLTLPSAEPYDFVHLVTTLLAAEQPVATYRHGGSWSDVGTPQALRDANRSYLSSDRLQQVATCRVTTSTGEIWGNLSVDSTPDLRVSGRVLLGSEVRVGTEVALRDTVVGTGSEIGSRATVVGSVLLPDTVVGAGERIVNRILGP